MGINKVVYNNETLVDLTSDTVRPDVLLVGYTAHDKSGEVIEGSMNICDLVYPVGSIYMSLNSTSPADLFGGEWEQLHGRFLFASVEPSGVWNPYPAGSTGGEYTHELTVNEMPAHTHTIPYTTYNTATSGTSRRFAAYSGSTVSTGSAGSGAAHNNMPPYLVVNMWKRTA